MATNLHFPSLRLLLLLFGVVFAHAHGRLEGKCALVTGGSGGIGQAIVEGFAREGAQVVFTYRNAKEAEAMVARMKQDGRTVHAVAMDLAKPGSVEAALKEVFTLTPRIDIFVNNAAMLITKSFLETTPKDLQDLFATNVFGPNLLCQVMARHMIERKIQGSIIHIGSFRGSRPVARLFAYSATKGTLNAMNTMMAEELAPYGIRVNLLAPGGTLTAMSRQIYNTEALVVKRGERVPLGRYGQPSDQVGGAIYLASDESQWTTGAVLTIDGGEATRN